MASEAVVNLVVNAAGADRQAAAQIRRIAADAERRAPTVHLNVDVDTRRLERALAIESDFLSQSMSRQTDRLAGRLERQFALLADSLDRVAAEGGATNVALARLNGTVDDLGRSARRAQDDTDRLGDSSRRLGDDADESGSRLSRLTGVLGGVGRASAGIGVASLRVLSLASVATSAIPVVAGLAAEVANMAPAAAVGVSALLTYQGAVGTLKLALVGVSDAVSEVFKLDSDPKKLAEALKNLSPNARSFVLELQRMKPAFDALRIDVQDRVFKGLNTTLAETGRVVFPQLRTAAGGFADTFNRMAEGIGASAREVSADGSLGKALDGSVSAFSRLRDIPGQVLESVVRLAAGGSGPLDRLSKKIADVATDLTDRLAKASESGDLERAIERAVDTIGQLGRVIDNVFGTLGNIFGIASEKGDGLFGTLEKITQALEDATGSKEFQDTLAAMIELGGTLVDTILPLILQAFQVLAPVIQELVPPLTEFVTLIGDRLAELLPELGPPLEQLATNVGLLLDALTPLIEEGINVLVEVMPSLTRLFESTAQIISELTPVIVFLAPFIGDVLAGAVITLVGAVTIANSILSILIDFVKRVAVTLQDFARTLVEVVVKAIDLVSAVLSGDWSKAWELAKSIVKTALDFAFTAVKNFVNGLLNAITTMGTVLPGGARRALNGLVTAAREKGREAVDWIKRAGSGMVNAVTGYASTFYNAGRNLISSFVRGISSMVSAAADAAKRVVKAARDFLPFSPAKKGPLSGRGYPLYSGRAFTKSFADGILSASGSLDSALGTLLGGLSGVQTPALALAPGGSPASSSPAASVAPRLNLNPVFTPLVNVHIGNERLRGYVQTVVDQNNALRDRLAAQGTGR